MTNHSIIHFCTACGKPVETRLAYGKSRPVCTSCGHIHFEDPKVAVAVLVVQDGKALLVRRINEPGRGLWTLPAGFVDAGEDPAEAAVRECQEETGLLVQVLGLLDVIGGREHPNGADIVIVYRAQVTGGELKAGDDADRAAFFLPEQIPALAFKATRRALSHWSKTEKI